MPELFVEILSEEIPARMQRRAADDLKRLVTDQLVDAGLTYEGVYASATPRRLILSVQGLPAKSADRREERKGPRVGAPQKALDGFLRAAGLGTIDDADIQSDPKKGDFYVARTEVPGRPAIDIAAEAIAETVRRFPWPVSMRWGAGSADAAALRWVRPLTSICATFGPDNEDPEIVPVALPDLPVGDATVGHRFHAPEPIRVRRLDDYQPALERARVVIDLDRRKELIADSARNAVFALGLELVEDAGLLEEVAGLVEWPVVLVGRFEAAALELPDEVIRLTIRENQKCFVTRDPATGGLSNAFVLTANLEASDGGKAIIDGNERVVRARLADARFFFEQDIKVPLEGHLEALKAVTYHERLGSQWARMERITALAGLIAGRLGADAALAERAARLAKADLATLMVGEFPELQGYMGRRYAEVQDEPAEVAAAIEAHYAPLGPSDAVPSAPVSLAVALADKLDQLMWLWAAGEKPTGSGDAFGLRRAALGIIRIILDNGLRLPLRDADGEGLLRDAWGRHAGSAAFEALRVAAPGEPTTPEDIAANAAFGEGEAPQQFLLDRFVVQQRDQGVPVEVVRAILPVLDSVDLIDITNRIAALQAFLASEDGATLMAGYRRATNILRAEAKKDGAPVAGALDRAALVEAQEIALADAIAAAGEAVAAALETEDYAAAMAALADLRAPVDAFFEAVLVNADNPDLRMNRLRLLTALADIARKVADFSQISG
ncbi:MAG: glycine--tRNA ligase subunit beta [Acuticoccus sp.]